MMGLALYLCHEPCITCGRIPEEGFGHSYTYNVSLMWYKIYPDDKSMVPIEGMTGKQAYKKLVYARDYMEKHKEELQELNPPNGWGSYEGFLAFINDCIQSSLDHPKLIWGAWR